MRLNRYTGLQTGETILLLVFSAALGIYIVSRLDPVLGWNAVGVSFSIFVFASFITTSSRCLAFPPFICLVSCIMWVVAPWLSYHYIPSWPLFRMVLPMDEYMRFVVPCAIALWVGMHMPLRISDNRVSPLSRRSLTGNERRLMDALILLGFGIDLLSPYLPGSFGAAYYMLAQLRFVGALSLMFSETKGWQIRVTLVYVGLFIKTIVGGVFYEFILWVIYLLISFAFLRKWRWKLLVLVLLSFYLSTVLNYVKHEYRAVVWQMNQGPVEKVKIFAGLVWKSQLRDDEEHPLGDKLIRWNQGWIIARVMDNVPKYVPYANGDTIKQAIINSLLPRVLFPNKLRVASREQFILYTGAPLGSSSMALGTAGEMYANFGLLGGILGTAAYGFLIGYIFSLFARLAKYNAMIWAWVPFVLLVALEAEWNIYDVLNYLTKSSFLFIAITMMSPSLRSLIFERAKRALHRQRAQPTA